MTAIFFIVAIVIITFGAAEAAAAAWGPDSREQLADDQRR